MDLASMPASQVDFLGFNELRFEFEFEFECVVASIGHWPLYNTAHIQLHPYV